MKRKFILAFTVAALFALSIAAFAYSGTSLLSATAASCCCSGDSCPMKKKDGAKAEKMSCCDKCDCCKDGKCKGGSCPMNKKGDSAHDGDHSGMQHNTEHKNCDCSCCKHDKEKKDTTSI